MPLARVRCRQLLSAAMEVAAVAVLLGQAVVTVLVAGQAVVTARLGEDWAAAGVVAHRSELGTA